MKQAKHDATEPTKPRSAIFVGFVACESSESEQEQGCWQAVTEERGKALPADLERFILLAELSGGSGSGGIIEQDNVALLWTMPCLLSIHIQYNNKMNKMRVLCFKCIDKYVKEPVDIVVDHNYLDKLEEKRYEGKFLVSSSEFNIDGGLLSAKLTCPEGHEFYSVFEMLHYEFLFALGVNSFVDCYYREAIMNFSSSLERFFEFALRAICYYKKIDDSIFAKSWEFIKGASERQYGAFVFSWLFLNEKPYTYMKEADVRGMVTMRNDVIHKGKMANKQDCVEYAEYVINIIKHITTSIDKEKIFDDYKKELLRNILLKTKNNKINCTVNGERELLEVALNSGFDKAVSAALIFRKTSIDRTPDVDYSKIHKDRELKILMEKILEKETPILNRMMKDKK